MNTIGLGYPVEDAKEYITGYSGQIKFVVTPTEVTKTGGMFPFIVKAGNRDYDVYVTMFRAQEDGIYRNEAEWKKAAIATQYDYSHWLKDLYLTYFPNTYDYTKR